MDICKKSRVRGAIIGTAIGDALGMPAECLGPKTIKRVYGKLKTYQTPKFGTWANKAHGLKSGQWTDDTQLMIAIAESIIEKKYLDFFDIAKKHILTFEKDPRGWGGSTISGISKIKNGCNWWNAGTPNRAGNGAGNGVVMKIAPIGVLMGLGLLSPFDTCSAVINISKMTHSDSRAAIAAILQAQAIAVGINGGREALIQYIAQAGNKAAEMENIFGSNIPTLSSKLFLGERIISKGGNIYDLKREIRCGCFVVESFSFVLLSILKLFQLTPEEILIEIVNQGGDADTNGAIAGALLGSSCGLSSFPSRFRKRLEKYKYLRYLADSLSNLNSLNENVSNVVTNFKRPRIIF